MQSNSHEFILHFLLLALAAYFGLRLFVTKSPVVGKSPVAFWSIGVSLIFYAVGQGPVLANEPKAPSSKVTVVAPTLDAIAQNTPGYSDAYAAGVPKTYGWCNGSYKPSENSVPPSNFTAVTGRGAIYPKFGAPAYSNPAASITVANAKTYIHLSATKEWILVQDQADDEITGAHFVADLAGNAASVDMKLNAHADGSVAVDSPPPGHNDLLWFSVRGTYEAGSVDGVYVQMDMKTNDPNLKLVAHVGADWWRDPESDYVQGFINNKGAGNSNWVELSTQWTTLVFYSASTERLRADPPPPLAESAREMKPTSKRRAENTPSPCLRTIAPR